MAKSTESRWTLKDLFTPKVKEATVAVNQFRDATKVAAIEGNTFAKSQASEAASLLKQKAAIKESEKAVKESIKTLNEFGSAVMGAIPFIGIGFAAALGKSVMSAQSFQNQMSQVGTLLNETGAQGTARLNQLSDQIMAISRESGASLPDLTAGMYQVISAFGDTADAAQQLAIADKAAVAGNSSVSDSVNLLSAVMKGYGDTSIAMEQKVSDLAMQTVKLGKTTYPELAASMSEVTSSAQLMGVKVQELFATQATLAVSLGGPSQVATDMASALKALMAPTTQMKTALNSLGYSTGQALIKAKGFKGALQDLVESTHGNTAALAKMFGRVEGMKLAIQLAGSASASYDQNLKAMQNSVGATDQAYQAATNTLQHHWKVALNDVTTGLIEMINKFHVLQGLSAILGAFSAHFKAIATVTGTVIAVVGTYIALTKAMALWTAIATLATGTEKVALTGSNIVMVASALYTKAYTWAVEAMKVETVAATDATAIAKIGMMAFNAVMAISPIGVVSIALVGLAAAAIWVGTHFHTTKLWVMDAWNGIVKATQWAINGSIDLVNDYLRVYKFAFDTIKWAGISIWDGILKAAQSGINNLLKLISPISSLLKHIGINIPSSVNFSGAMVQASAPKWDTSFGFKHVDLSGGEYSSSQLATQRQKAQAEWGKKMDEHTKALNDNTKAIKDNSKSTDANTSSSNANTTATQANTSAHVKGNGGNMSAEQIADTLMPRLERHLYGTT